VEQENIKETKTVFKVIFAWQDEKEEKWLEEMAASGWHLLSVAPFVYTFQRGTPEVVTYRLDYKLTTNKDYPEYVSIFRDSGWELVASMANWHYYRIKSENSNTPEIYNSSRAKAQKYRRLLAVLLPFLPIYLVILNPGRLANHEELGKYSLFFDVTQLILFIFIIFLCYAVIRIGLKIRKLESHPGE